ncbi:MAG TPA: DEAD/DEAH box helicase [Tissierellales bacterium]|nr:DEAD/DEAH box helicase [Tissierellales bacterium]
MNKTRFEEMDVSKEIKKAVSDMGFEEASPIQAQAIPYLMEGRDVVGQAQTGTGKTAAFGIPIIERINSESRQLQSIVLCPTRELSIQVAKEIKKLAKYKKEIFVLPVYGGQPIERQIKALKKGVQIVIGTPGRVIDHIKRGTLKLDNIEMMVLDEADEMFDMGFRDDIELVINKTPKDRQTVFFSATMDKKIINFAKKYQKTPKYIRTVPKELTVPNIEQYYLKVKKGMKTEILSRLLDIQNSNLSIVFCNTKRKVDELIIELQGRGYFADGIHGDLKQSQRDKVMSKFRKGNIDILVATDVAARGIDVDNVDIVFNYDIPQDLEYYVHRIGRTARAGKTGKAYSLVVGRDINKLKDIEKYAKTKVVRKDIPTLNEVAESKTTDILGKIKHEIGISDLSKYETSVELLLEEGYKLKDIAAGLLKLYFDDKSEDKNRKLESKNSEEMERLYINIGRKDGVRPRHIVGGIYQLANISRDSIGDIDIYDKFSFIEAPRKYTNDILDSLNNNRIKGKKVRVEVAMDKKKKR